MRPPRIALGAFMLESNGHAPVATRAEFEAACWLEGDALAADLTRPAPRAPTALTGFIRAMDAGRPWTGVPLVAAAAGASGPMDQDAFDALVAATEDRLRAAMPVDGVFLSLHGAATDSPFFGVSPSEKPEEMETFITSWSSRSRPKAMASA